MPVVNVYINYYKRMNYNTLLPTSIPYYYLRIIQIEGYVPRVYTCVAIVFIETL